MSNAAACIVPQNTRACPTPDTDWNAPAAHAKAAVWYQEVLGWCMLPAHYLLNWRDTGIYVCSCGKHTTCPTAGKHPTRPWQKLEAALPVDELRRAWTHGKRVPWNLSLLTGHRSGVIVADLDNKPIHTLSVDERLDLLREEGWPVDETCVERTGGSGLHIMASLPRDIEVPSRGVYLCSGIELFAEAKQIIISPSKHQSGRRYAWLEGREPWAIGVAPLPQATLTALLTPSTSPVPSPSHATPRVTPAGNAWPPTRGMTPPQLVSLAVERAHECADGGRHPTLIRLASRVARVVGSKEELTAYLLDYQRQVEEGWAE